MTSNTNAFTDVPPFSEYHLNAGVRLHRNDCSITLNQVPGSLSEHDQQLFRLRLWRWFQDFYIGQALVFGHRKNVNELVQKIIDSMVGGYTDNLTQ